jgi:hypothetical protein
MALTRWTILTSAGLCLLAVGASPVWASEIGGPPTLDVNRCDDFIDPCGEPLVLGVSRHPGIGPVEVVGMAWAEGPCVYFDSLAPRSGAGYCTGSARPSGFIEASLILRPTRRSTEIAGELDPAVAAVRVRFRRRGEVRRRQAAVVNVPPDLAEFVGEASGAFSVYELTVKGCIPGRRFKAIAINDAGQRLGHTAYPASHDC